MLSNHSFLSKTKSTLPSEPLRWQCAFSVSIYLFLSIILFVPVNILPAALEIDQTGDNGEGGGDPDQCS